MDGFKILALSSVALLASCAPAISSSSISLSSSEPVPSSGVPSSQAPSSSAPSTGSVSSSSSAPSSPTYDPDTYEGAKGLLRSQLTEDNVIEVNGRAIAQGLYKPMFDLTHSAVTHLVYPYAVPRQLYNVLDPGQILVLDKPITSADYASTLSQGFIDKESAASYLKGLGYELKNEATLPLSIFFGEEPITEDYQAKQFLSRKLFVADPSGALKDDAASLTQDGEKKFTLSVKEGATWRDVSGNATRSLTADDVLNGYAKAYDHGLFKSVTKASDSSLVFTAKEALGLEEAKWAIAVSYGSPKPASNGIYFLADEFSSTVLEDGYRFIKDGFSLDLRRNDESIVFDIVDASEAFDSSYYVKERINFGLKTYGFVLNPEAGNDAYRSALDDVHFRKAILSLLRHEDIRTLTHNSYISRGIYDTVADSYAPTYQSGRDLPAVALSEGVEEAVTEFAQAEDLPEGVIELYVGDASLRNEKVALLQELFAQVFGDRVTVSAKTYPDEQFYYFTPTGYPYLAGKRTFYSEIELDGFFYPSGAAYIKSALSI